MRSLAWRFVKYVYSRPVIASVLIGASIHALMEVNGYLFKGISHISHLQEELSESFIYGSLCLMIPFLVPYFVTQIGRQVKMEAEAVWSFKFPEANPDIVMKLESSAELLYMNNAAGYTLKRLSLRKGEVNGFLPGDVASLLADIIGTDRIVSAEKLVNGFCFEFRFRAFPGENAVFVSVREVSHFRKVEEAEMKRLSGACEGGRTHEIPKVSRNNLNESDLESA